VSFYCEYAMDLVSKIRTVDDFPSPGIKFLDVTSILLDPGLFNQTIKALEKIAVNNNVQSIVGIDARGFVWAGAVASRLHCPLFLARKPGKLPGNIVTQEYQTEYSTASLSMIRQDNITGPVMVIDDILATGGTLSAVGSLLTKNWNIPASDQIHATLVSLDFLPGFKNLSQAGYKVVALDHLN
jgi:adenine phosphoribosyltransferase